jgi:hypothetical protein
MRVVQLGEQLELVATAHAPRRRRPLADAVHREHRRFCERRGIEGARRVRLVVLGEQRLAREAVQLIQDQLSREQLLAQPHRHGGDELSQPLRRDAEILLEEPLELEQRLVVEGDVVELLEREAPLGETVGDGAGRKTGVVTLAREALLLRRRDDLAVPHQAGGRIVVVRRDAENRRHQNCWR